MGDILIIDRHVVLFHEILYANETTFLIIVRQRQLETFLPALKGLIEFQKTENQ